MVIKFGTDGWRAIIDQDFNDRNVAMLAQAVANYLINLKMERRGVAIGYDTRRKSKHFAKIVAEVFAGNDIPVMFTEDYTPTPALAYTVLKHKLAGAVMITASHNPPEWNGFKFIPYHTGPALPEETSAIESEISKVYGKKVRRMDFEKAISRGLITLYSPKEDYAHWVLSFLDLNLLKNKRLKVIVDPMHGASCGYLDYILSQIGCEIEVIHGTPDPLFGGLTPEPIEKNLHALSEHVVLRGADIGLATDGDADRVGVCDVNGVFISPNQLYPLLYLHLIEFKNMKGNVARTVSTTHLVDRIAEHYGYQSIETPVGFKYIGKLLREGKAIIGGEESGGFSIVNHVSEKDGILTALLAAEIKAELNFSLTSRLNQIHERYGFMISGRVDVRCEKGREVVELIKRSSISKVAGLEVSKVIDIDGIKFVLRNGSWLLLRASGTEPLLRIYAESNSREKLEELLGFGKKLAEETSLKLA
ncbi:MAG: phosphoglucomutase/phosphomannomutase family protein [Candidatus Methanomethylicota archaeon]|uniref:Phosphoglucomutase/phosphomannomutase family protein n=1 Tax=Thermoproteota archaeon TaxID=2056631 RepID=A0A497F373_9CREN|nr:MAG: phosphoglucomutase/phosphomannomutase family protein [Candidatus Verstraetearchaeota archaeon]RLE53791.1 MAG: phosphoglucomutase/phosphomannomutase family protein [Candidatus Verstraetearchaeota archaeon]